MEHGTTDEKRNLVVCGMVVGDGEH